MKSDFIEITTFYSAKSIGEHGLAASSTRGSLEANLPSADQCAVQNVQVTDGVMVAHMANIRFSHLCNNQPTIMVRETIDLSLTDRRA